MATSPATEPASTLMADSAFAGVAAPATDPTSDLFADKPQDAEALPQDEPESPGSSSPPYSPSTHMPCPQVPMPFSRNYGQQRTAGSVYVTSKYHAFEPLS